MANTTTSTIPATAQTPNDILATLHETGYVVIPQLIPASSLPALRAAASRATLRARAGRWPHIRALPKQFPPWPSSPAAGIWGVQHLLHPAQPDAAAFAALYFSDAVLEPVKALLAEPQQPAGPPARDEDLVMELCNLLVRPGRLRCHDDAAAASSDENDNDNQTSYSDADAEAAEADIEGLDFALRWHRDDVRAHATPEEEQAALGISSPSSSSSSQKRRALTHTQYNIALYADSSLHLVPGSHRRARTPAERTAPPYAPSLPGSIAVALGPGDAVFYDNNVLHRGVYDARAARMTVHASVGHVRAGREGRARNVLQHGVGEWVGRAVFEGLDGGDRVRSRAEGMRRRLVELGSGREFGYTHED